VQEQKKGVVGTRKRTNGSAKKLNGIGQARLGLTGMPGERGSSEINRKWGGRFQGEVHCGGDVERPSKIIIGMGVGPEKKKKIRKKKNELP